MSAVQLRKEFNAIVQKAWGDARENILNVLKNNLPDETGTPFYAPYTSLAGTNLYATGALRDSYEEITLVPGSPVGHTGRLVQWRSNSPYAYYYANGRINSETYHGFDFIEATKRELERRGDIISHQIF